MKKVAVLLISLIGCSSAFCTTLIAHNGAEQAFLAYVEATRTKDLGVLSNLIADDYMTVNGRNKVATKQDEIAEAKSDPAFDEMQVDELHSLIVHDTAVISGIISAAYTSSAGKPVKARVRVLATLLRRHGHWQISADESAPTH